MNLSALRTEFRILVDDTRAPYLWSNASVDRYINEAQVEAATRAWLLYEFDGVATSIPLVPGVANYPLHKAILRIDRAELRGSGRALRVGDARDPHADVRVEQDTRALVLARPPTAYDTLMLGAFRLPLRGL